MRQSAVWSIFVAGTLAVIGGCGETPKKQEAPAKPEMLDKLDSDDPDKFLEGVDEAREKYGKKP